MSAELVGPAPCAALSTGFHLKTRGHSPTLPKELLLLVDSMQMAARNAEALYLTMVDLTGLLIYLDVGRGGMLAMITKKMR